jgi:alpha-tubulin suppressor-like RCC1 family protein
MENKLSDYETLHKRKRYNKPHTNNEVRNPIREIHEISQNLVKLYQYSYQAREDLIKQGKCKNK